MGSAAIVGDTVISQKTVTDQLKETLSEIAKKPNQAQGSQAVKQDAGVLGQQIVNRLVLSELINAAVKDLEVKVTDAQVFRLQDEIYGQYGKDKVDYQLLTNQAIPASQVSSFFRLLLDEEAISKKLTPQGTEDQSNAAFSKYMTELAKNSRISVAPRYGAWSSDQWKVTGVDNTLSSLSSAE